MPAAVGFLADESSGTPTHEYQTSGRSPSYSKKQHFCRGNSKHDDYDVVGLVKIFTLS
jgi:hypothetical protein